MIREKSSQTDGEVNRNLNRISEAFFVLNKLFISRLCILLFCLYVCHCEGVRL